MIGRSEARDARVGGTFCELNAIKNYFFGASMYIKLCGTTLAPVFIVSRCIGREVR